MRSVLVLSALLFFAAAGLAETIDVPDDFATIQDAVNAAAEGDTVLVAPGVYNENIEITGKSILLRSTFGSGATTIDGGLTGSAVRFDNIAGSNALLEGFTIKNGLHLTGSGGGVACINASPTIRGNVIRANSATITGGGIYCENSSALIEGNAITGNNAPTGGGIYFKDSDLTIASNTICGNITALFGGGIYCRDATALIVNNTLADNISGTGAGIGSFSSTLDVVNSVLWGNDALIGPAIWIGNFFSTSIVNISYSDVKDGKSGVHVQFGSTLNWGDGMVDADPLFVGGDDYHLSYGSPCRNGGDNAAAGATDDDFEGDPRIEAGGVDMGGDEFHIHLYYTGLPSPGNAIEIRYIGKPNTNYVFLNVSFYAFPDPLWTPWGYWQLGVPFLPLKQAPIGADGVGRLPLTVPIYLIEPFTIYMQAQVGHGIGNRLTNLCVMNVRFELWD